MKGLKSLFLIAVLLSLATPAMATLTRIGGTVETTWTNYDNDNPQLLSGTISGDLVGTIDITAYPEMQSNIPSPYMGASHGELTASVVWEGGNYECEGVFTTTIINQARNKGPFFLMCSHEGLPDVKVEGILVGFVYYNTSSAQWDIFRFEYIAYLNDHETQINNIWTSLGVTQGLVSSLEARITTLENTMLDVQNSIQMLKNQFQQMFEYLETIRDYIESGHGPPPSFCGDGVCDSGLGETAETCPTDCHNGEPPGEIYITQGWVVTCPEEFTASSTTYTIDHCRAELYKNTLLLRDDIILQPGWTKKVNYHAGYTLKLYGVPV